MGQHTPHTLLSVFGACSIQEAAHPCLHVSAGPCALSAPCREHAQTMADVLSTHAWVRVCVASVVHTDPFLITSLIWNSAPISGIARTPCPCKSCPPQAASVEGLVAWLPHPSAKPLSHRPSHPTVNQPAGSVTHRTLRRPWQSLCPSLPSGLPFAGGSRVTLPIPVSERTHLCLWGLFWIPGKL